MGAAEGPVRTPRSVAFAMVLASVGFAVALLEFAVFPVFLNRVPLRLQMFLPDGIQVLAQSSKSGSIPEDYVLLVGDSYAQGRGDWLLDSDPDRNPPFHSAHVVHERTGRDVVSFARGGAGAIRGWVTEPEARFRYLESTYRFRLERPARVVAYFYEGNDLQDTLLELLFSFGVGDAERNAAPGEPPLQNLLQSESPGPYYLRQTLEDDRLYDGEHYRTHLFPEAADRHPLNRERQRLGVTDEFFLLRSLFAMADDSVRRVLGKKTTVVDLWPNAPPRRLVKEGNAIEVSGSAVAVERELQGPAMELNQNETRAALFATEQALIRLRSRFGASLLLVYLPSPASSYSFARAPVVLQPTAGRPHRYSVREIAVRSAELRERMAAMAAKHQIEFLDVTPAIRASAREQILHGPRDWRHFNRLGYEVLGEQVSRAMAR